ncbi:hypothetical protein PIB30_027581 [Stylosanthes scabra]|uniref:Transmembrane protein n=1 Tax=Stylosanthes scabra TaxID=79078 RepID=A0ABU6WAF0_9FABA|nr:hypothetical protein [Stylosanthes scabra]
MVEDHHHHHLHLPVDVPSKPSMVVIRNAIDYDATDCSVFPPINHENLPQSPPSSPSSSSSSSSTFSPPDSDTWRLDSSCPIDSQLGKRTDFLRLLFVGVDILRSKLLALTSSFRAAASTRGAFWSIWMPAATVLMSLWIIMRRKSRRRRRSFRDSENRFLDIIHEKDERIAQLLDQIAEMNKLLIDRYKALAAKGAQ